MRIVVALGGNALGDTPQEQLEIVKGTAKAIVDLVEQDHDVIVVHGNGPQVGMINNNMESANVPFSECGAMSQGYIGYHLQVSIQNQLVKRGNLKHVATLITEVVVDKNDPAFQNPTKPIGKFYTKEEMDEILVDHDYDVIEDSGRGYRRVVPSPKPIDIVERDAIEALFEQGTLVITCGGGGIPVIKENGQFEGIPAVIDKDFAASKLAQLVDADALCILTAVDYVAINFGTPEQENLKEISADKLSDLKEKDYFGKGSMLPKVEAILEFVNHNNEDKSKIGIIASLEKVTEAVKFNTGTIVRK